MSRNILLLLCLSLAAFAGERNDIEFARAGGEPLLLDSYTPDSGGPHPAVIIVHGGGFLRGDKRTYVPPMFPLLSQAGFAWFSINYRMAPKATLADSLEDVRSAIRYVKDHAKEYKVDTRRIFLLGESAGGALVALIGVKDRGKHGLTGIVDFYGPHDFVKLNQDRKERNPGYVPDAIVMKYFGGAEAKESQRIASAVTYMGKGVPPMLLIHGTGDETVYFDQSTLFCEALKKAGNECELISVQGGPHGMSGWEKNVQHQSYKPLLVEWLKKTAR